MVEQKLSSENQLFVFEKQLFLIWKNMEKVYSTHFTHLTHDNFCKSCSMSTQM